MKIIHKYILKEFIKVLLICLSGFILVFLLVEITDKIKYYFEYNPPAMLMAKYFLVKLPGYLFFALPLSILLGGMLSLLMLARNSEIIAMQANGIDALSIAKPVLLIGIVSVFGMFVSNETIIPWSNRYSEHIQNVQIAKKNEIALLKQDSIWMKTSDSILQVMKFNGSDNSIQTISMIRWDSEYNFLERIYADKAKWWKDHWTLYGVNRTFKDSHGKYVVENLPTYDIVLSKDPKEFAQLEPVAKEMNLVQLGSFIGKLHREGQSATRYIVDWHDKIAFPFVCLIMAALSVPFAVKMNPRSGGVAVGIGLSLMVAFGYWIIHTIFIALGHGGYIPPIAAGWGTNIIFGLASVMMLLKAGT